MKNFIITSVKRKLDLLIGGLILLFAIFVYLYFPYILENEQTKSLEANATSITEISSIIVSAGLFFDDYEAISEGIDPILQDKNISYLIVENLVDSIYYSFNVQYAKKLNYKAYSYQKPIQHENDILLSSDIILQENKLGKIYLGYSLSNLMLKLEETKDTITIITMLVLILGLILASFFGNFITRPLTKMVETVNKIASGDLSLRAKELTKDELGYLAKSFNNMLDIIQSSQKEFEDKNEQLSEEITIRKIAEQNLKISENRFRLIFHKSNDFIFLSEIMKNNTDKIIEANDVTSKALGYSHKELHNLSHYDLISPKCNSCSDMIDVLLENGTLIREAIYRTKEERDFSVEVNANLFDLHGRKVILSIARDITERKEAEAALRDSEERFRNIYNNATIGIYRTSAEGEILMANPAIIDMLGFENYEELVESNNIKNVYGKTESRTKFTMLAEQQNVISGFEAVWIKKNGDEIFVRESARVVRNDEGKLVYYEGVVEDITNWKKTELALIKAKEKAEESDRLKSEFLAQMSHEIRTPINTIMNFTSLLRMEMEDSLSEDLSGSFNSIENAANRLLRTIDLVLNMSDIESGTYEARPDYLNVLEDILSPVFSEFARAAKIKNLDLNLIKNTEDSKVFGDNYTITQIIANLVDNAIKYTDTGSVEIILNNRKENLEICIKDTGIGIAKEYLPKLFQKFSQEEQGYTRRYEGNGLGLALVKEYCEINRAEITVVSKKGEGSCFNILLPRKSAEIKKAQ